MKPPSLLRELAFDLMVAHLAAVVVIVVLVMQTLGSTVSALESRDMREMAADVLAGLTPAPDGSVGLALSPSTQARFSPSYGRYVYAVLDDRGRILCSSAGLTAPPGPGDAATFQSHPGAAALFGVTLRGAVAGRPVLVQVAEDMNHRDVLMDEVADAVLARVVWSVVPIYVVLVTMAVLRTRRRLRPLIRVSEAAAHIGPRATGFRLPEINVPQEVRPLVAAVNTGLARLEHAFAAQREFIEDAAHELRTPLTVLRTRVEATLDPAAGAPLLDDIAIMSRTVTQLLRIAELEGIGAATHSTFDLAQLTRAIATYLAPVGRAKGRTVTVNGPDSLPVDGNAEVLGQAVNNLVENALAHSPEGAAVEVTLASLPCPTIRVRDHGPGIPPAERELVFQRFWRRERRRGTGAGLGLSIVRRAVELHGGRVAVGDAEGGGAQFTITLPQTAADAPPPAPAAP